MRDLELYSVNQARRLLGGIARNTLYRMLDSGELASVMLAHTLGLGAPLARLPPADKLQYMRALQAHGRQVLMTGDGINDGPVLAAANVSLAMGNGSSIAHAAHCRWSNRICAGPPSTTSPSYR